MLCSTAGKSNSNWLHRLRSSKGFPSSSSATDLDLEHFLTHHHHPIPPNLGDSDPKPAVPQVHPDELQNPTEDKRLFSIMSNVLAELFIMGDSSSNLPKIHSNKCSRKQPNPKPYVPLNSSDSSNNLDRTNERKNDSASPVSDDNSGVGLGKKLCGDEQVKLVEHVNCGGEEEEKGYGNLSGFSRTEVTVIDTSFAGWKFEKMLFRKKNVWKVRDKKGKPMNFGKKKRKYSNVDTGNSCGGEVKKPKGLDGQCGLPKIGAERDFNEEYHQNSISQTACRKMSDNFGKALKNKQATSNLEIESSSVVLIKNIPTGKKSGASIPRSCSKSTQRHLKV